ncbi:hypothetical protein HPY86_06235 [candidate division WOR-3 bacterium]|jgi:hypothetical protein|nr:hypothetical protein [candidate division WOR-3 bacterium]
MNVTAVLAQFFRFAQWVAYLLLVSCMLDLVFKERSQRGQETAIFQPHGVYYGRSAFDTPPEKGNLFEEAKNGREN